MPTPLIGPLRDLPYSSLERVLDDAVGEVYDQGAFFLAEQLAAGVAEAGAQAFTQVLAFIEGLENTVRSSRNQMTNAHEQLARGMQQATLRSYKQKRAQGRMAGPYRVGDRDAGGKLESAIRSPMFVRATYDGIGFANTEVLDSMARQWHRLNFGAGQAAGPGPRRFAVHWGNVAMAALGLEDTPSDAFVLPRGFWRGPGGQIDQGGAEMGKGRFYPNKRGPGPKATRGIRAWNFLDAGVAYLAENLPRAYEAVYRDWYDSAGRGLGPLTRVQTVKPPAPRRLPSSVSRRRSGR